MCLTQPLLSFQVFRVAYCLPFSEDDVEDYQMVCRAFVDAVKQHLPHILKKQKLLLHLVDCMKNYGPCSAFNTERYIYTHT